MCKGLCHFYKVDTLFLSKKSKYLEQRGERIGKRTGFAEAR